jgi:hypothetical protein
MTSEMKEKYDVVDERLGKSEVLKRLGYVSRSREDVEESAHLPSCTQFHLVTGKYRCLSIGCCYLESGDLLLTFEIFHTMLDESFMLEDWTRPLRDPNAPYAFLTSAYSGDFKEQLDQLICYVETLLTIDEIDKILKGEIWTTFASQL